MTILASDNFDSDTSGVIAPGWVAINGTWAVGTTDPISGAKSFGETTNTAGTVAVYTGIVSRADGVISYTEKITDVSTSASYYAGFRGAADWSTGYLFGLEKSTNLQFAFYTKSGSTYSQVSTASAVGLGLVASDVVNIEVTMAGTSFEFRVWKVGTSRPSSPSLAVTNTSFATGYAALYRGSGLATSLAIDDFVFTDGVAAAATAVTLTGPTSGVVSTASTNFTAALSPSGGTVTGTVTVTPSDSSGGGTFSPTSVGLTTASPSANFTYTPGSTGAKTVSVTNNGSLTNPSTITYTSNAAATVPGAPTIGTATAGNAQATVTFTAPGSNGGSAITGYVVTSSPGGFTGSVSGATASPITVTGLTNGTAYTFTVHATNSVGNSSESSASNSVTPSAGVTVSGVTVSPSTATVNGGATQAFTVVVAGTGSPSQFVTWTTSAGTITSGGTLTAPAATGSSQTVTVTATSVADNTKSGTATVTVPAATSFPVTNAAVYFSPGNWYSDGAGSMQANNIRASSTLAWSNMRGSYLKFRATVGSSGAIGLTIVTGSLSGLNAAGCPQIAWSINAGSIQSHTLVSGETALNLVTGLAAGTYEVAIWFRGVYITQDGDVAQNYTTPNNRFQISAINVSTGGSLSATTIRPKIQLSFGDSITEGDLSNGGPRSATSQDATLVYPWYLAESLNAEVGIIGFYGQLWSWFNSSWANYASGFSRLISGLLSPAPDYITINYGENDGNPGPASSTVTATLAAIATAAPSAKIILLIPFSGRALTNLSAATLPANGYRINLARYEMQNGNLVWSYDGQHPNQRGHANLASLLSYAINTAVAAGPTLTSRTISVTIRDSAGSLRPNLTGLEWCFSPQPRTGLKTTIEDRGTGLTTNSSGVATITVMTSLPSGGVGGLEISTSDGTVTQSPAPKAFCGPVTVI